MIQPTNDPAEEGFDMVDPASEEGGPVGFDPYSGADVVVVDPGEPDSVRLNMAKLRANKLANRDIVSANFGSAQTLEGRQAKTVELFRQLSKASASPAVNTQQGVLTPVRTAPAVRGVAVNPDAARFTLPVPSSSARPAPVVAPVAPARTPANMNSSAGSLFQSGAAVVASGNVPPPHICVRYEIEGFPMTMEGFFHQVIVNEDAKTLVLVFNADAIGYPRNFPPLVEQKVAIQVADDPTIYVTLVTGHRFRFEPTPETAYDMAVLLISATRKQEELVWKSERLSNQRLPPP